MILPINWGHSFRVDPTYFFQESILTEALHDTPTFEVPQKPSYYTFLSHQIIIYPMLLQPIFNPNPNLNQNYNCHSLVLILILISIKTRIDNIFGQKPPPHHHHPPGTQPCLILPKLLTFEVIHQNKSCLSILE